LSEPKAWLWIRVPVRALLAAIDALKERAMARHAELMRQEADADDAHAEDLKASLRGVEEPPADLRWPKTRGED
jgi:hypothetical protein